MGSLDEFVGDADLKKNIILFEDKELKLEVPFTPEEETVWLNRIQMATLFGRDVKTIGKHIGNALREELDSSTVAKFATVQTEGEDMQQAALIYDYLFAAIISPLCAANPT